MPDFTPDEQDSKFVPDEPEPAPHKPVSGAESLARGAGQGLTAGFSDEAGGVGAALYDLTHGGNPGEAYKTERDAQRAENAQAAQDNPGLYTGGELAGMAATTLATGGAGAEAGAGKALLTAGQRAALADAGWGAAVGFGHSEADTVGGQLADTAKGAAAGLLTGGAVRSLGKAGQVTAPRLAAQAARTRVANTGLSPNQVEQAGGARRLDPLLQQEGVTRGLPNRAQINERATGALERNKLAQTEHEAGVHARTTQAQRDQDAMIKKAGQLRKRDTVRDNPALADTMLAPPPEPAPARVEGMRPPPPPPGGMTSKSGMYEKVTAGPLPQQKALRAQRQAVTIEHPEHGSFDTELDQPVAFTPGPATPTGRPARLKPRPIKSRTSDAFAPASGTDMRPGSENRVPGHTLQHSATNFPTMHGHPEAMPPEQRALWEHYQSFPRVQPGQPAQPPAPSPAPAQPKPIGKQYQEIPEADQLELRARGLQTEPTEQEQARSQDLAGRGQVLGQVVQASERSLQSSAGQLLQPKFGAVARLVQAANAATGQRGLALKAAGLEAGAGAGRAVSRAAPHAGPFAAQTAALLTAGSSDPAKDQFVAGQTPEGAQALRKQAEQD